MAASRRLVEVGGVEGETVGDMKSLVLEWKAWTSRARLRIDPYASLAVMSDDDFGWAVDWADPDFLRNLRNRTFLVVGTDLARRAIEMARFDMADFDECPDDTFGVEIRNPKAWPPGTVLRQHLDHVYPEHPWCPACSMGIWLNVPRKRYSYETGPAFPAKASGQSDPRGRISTSRAREIVRQLWREAHPGDDRRVASRSMRVGGSTDGWELGQDLDKIADIRTLHRCLDMTALYVRRNDSRVDHFRYDL
jgi:hypothetical protein